MLVKQHTVFDNMDESVLSLQGQRETGNPVRRYYKSLGFNCTDNCDDGGLMLTSPAFQEAVKTHPQLWIQGSTVGMSLYQLFKGRMVLQEGTLTFEHIDKKVVPDGKSDLMGYKFAKFPCNLSMNTIEGHLDSRPVLRLLSGEALAHTECPLLFTKSVSTISGIINGDSQQNLVDDECFPSHDELQFLLAFLLCS